MEELNNTVSVINLAEYKAPIVTESTKKDFVEYGEDNDYYDWLIERTRKSTTNGSIINNISRLIYGRGIGALDASRKPSDYAVLMSLISSKALRGVASNFKTLGAGYFSVSYNENHTKILKVDYIQTRLIRAGKCNEEGVIDKFYFSNDWSDLRKHPEKMIPAFGTSKESIELYCIKFDSLDMKYYSDVDYSSCLPYAVLEEEIADFLINDVQNHFSGSKIINFNNGTGTPESRKATDKAVRQRLTGSKGDKVIIAYNDNKEHATTIEDIALDDASEHYSYLAKEAQSKILNAHGVISPMIVGIVTESQGFSSSADEIEVATKVFYNQQIVPFQEHILEAVREFLAFNGANLKDLYFKRLNLMDSVEEKQQEKEEANLKMSSDFDKIISEFGEEESEEWELIDSREVDYDNELELDSQFANWGETKLKKIALATGVASPNKPSLQDREIDGFHFKVRYKYVGNPSPERGFCKQMMRASKIYRKEDIITMGKRGINRSHAHKDQFMNIWKFKGGVSCHHKWERRTYVSSSKNASIGSYKTNQISTGKARKFGYKPTNEREVSMKPKDMVNNGHHPDYNN